MNKIFKLKISLFKDRMRTTSEDSAESFDAYDKSFDAYDIGHVFKILYHSLFHRLEVCGI